MKNSAQSALWALWAQSALGALGALGAHNDFNRNDVFFVHFTVSNAVFAPKKSAFIHFHFFLATSAAAAFGRR